MPYTTPSRSAAARGPVNKAGHYWPMPPQETLRLSKANLAQSCGLSLLLSLCPGTHQVLFTASEYLWWAWNFILNVIASLLPSYWGFSFALGCEVCFLVGPNILLLMVFSSCLWFWCFHRRRWAHILLLCHLKSSLWEMLMDGKN